MKLDSISAREERVIAAWRWLEHALEGRPLPPLLIVVGLGDGALLEALDERAPAIRVLALEPDPAPARALLATPRCNAWRAAGRLVYLADPDYAGADEAWRVFRHKDEPRVVVHPTALQAPGNARAIAVLKKVLDGVQANAQARRRFAPRYLTNVLRNLPAIAVGGDVRSLANTYQGMPAVIAAAGPSLDAAICHLPDAAPHAVLIACDTALRPMLHAGLKPQLVVGADPSAANARHFQSLPECGDTCLVAESALDPSAAAVFHDRTFWFRVAAHHPWPWLQQHGIDVGLVDMWGSVLTAALQVACLVGCDPIIIVGADLAHTGGRPYARTTTYELDWAHAVARGETPEQTWRGHIASTHPIERPDRDGMATTTTPTMLAFRDWLVARAKRSGRRVINATGAGMLFGDGVEQATLAESLAGARQISPARPITHAKSSVESLQVAGHVAAVRRVAAAQSSDHPVDQWLAFGEGNLDHAALVTALDEAARGLEARAVAAPRSIVPYAQLFGSSSGRAVFNQLPESIERLKIGLSGAPLSADREDHGVLLVCALEVLAAICEHVKHGPASESHFDAARFGMVPVSALYDWPEPLRWAVVTFEALLGRAWHHPVPPVALTAHSTDGGTPGARTTVDNMRSDATRACVALTIEWLRCYASLRRSPSAKRIDAAQQLACLRAVLPEDIAIAAADTAFLNEAEQR